MKAPLQIFIGWDPSEVLAWHVLAHSIYRRASVPVAIVPLALSTLREFDRPRHPLQSTEFSFSRFLVPALSQFVGTSVFMDCDMLCLGDVAELVEMASPYCPVSVVQHDYRPQTRTKMLGQRQSRYPMSKRWGNTKNWSSVMVFQNSLCRALTPKYVQEADGLALHQFGWVGHRDIGWLDPSWNVLVTQEGQPEREKDTPAARARGWLAERLAGGPVASKALYREAAAAGISHMTLRRAQRALGVEAGKRGMRGPWFWRLPGPAVAAGASGARLLHWTEGGPWWPQYACVEHAQLWRDELADMGGVMHGEGLQPETGQKIADAQSGRDPSQDSGGQTGE